MNSLLSIEKKALKMDLDVVGALVEDLFQLFFFFFLSEIRRKCVSICVRMREKGNSRKEENA